MTTQQTNERPRLAHRRIDSPFGPLLLAATEDGLVRLAFEREDHDRVVARLERRFDGEVRPESHRLDDIARQLDEYFAGRLRAFEVTIDRRLAHGFRRTALDAVRAIPYGSSATYGDIAGASGHSGAVRAVGSACATNPVPIVVPCHRVVRGDGTIGQYLGGADVKRALLAMEAERGASGLLEQGSRIDLNRFRHTSRTGWVAF